MFNRYRVFAAYLFAVPLALILGFLAASPGEISFMLIGMLLFFLTLPLLITWHHALLIIFWNAAFNAFFLPGQPNFYLVFAGLSFGMSVLNHIMGRRPFLHVPEMTRPLLFFAAVVALTALYRGGFGLRSFGGAAIGGRNYFYVFGAIIGYFALTAGQISISKCRRMAALHFLSGTTYVLSNLAYTLGPGFFFLYYLVPSGFAMSQAANDFGLSNIDRIQGLGQASVAAMCFLLVCYGIRGLFEWSKPWRLALMCLAVGASFFAGFRSVFVLICLIFVIQFYFEGLVRTRLFPAMVALAMGCIVAIMIFSNRMPLSVQRAISFLPVNVDSAVRADALSTSEWRLQMWAIVWKDVPKYLLVGKGYSIDASEMELVALSIRMGILSSYEESMLAGDYHNGPLSVLVPFGIAGVMAFLWLLIACFRVLWSNYRHGDPRLYRVNSVLLSYYLANVISFFFIFGALNYQLSIFLGVCGLSVSLNGGVKRKVKDAPEQARDSVLQPYAVEVK